MAAPGAIDRVLFCVADQWRGDALGALGTPGVVTPNLDALAGDGVLLANHWCEASPCGPSRSSLLTGTHVSTHGQWTNDDPADHGLPTLPAVLRAAGVTPTLIGYTDTPTGSREAVSVAAETEDWRPLVDPAFDVALPFIWQHGFPTWRDALKARGRPVDHDHPFGLYAPDSEPDAEGLAPARYRAEDSDVAFLTDAAIDAIAAGAPRSLLHLNWLRPHPPMTPPRPYHRLVDPDAVALPAKPLAVEKEAARHPYLARTVPDRSMTEYLQRRCRLDAVGEREDRHLRAAYYGLVAEVDHHIGRIVAELRAAGLYDSTLIIVASDHGDALGDHWIYGRRGPFDGHFRVPCIIRDPRPSADGGRGSVVTDFTANIDLLPTIAAALGIGAPATVEGRSLLDLIAGRGAGDGGWRTHVRYAMSFDDHLTRSARSAGRGSAPDNRFTVVRTDRHRLVTFPTLPPLLTDLVEDPDETVDRAADPTLRATLSDLLALANPAP